MREVKDTRSAKYSLEYHLPSWPFISVTIHQAVWLFPVCIVGHFLEEATGFSKLAQRNISSRYTERHWRRIHGAGLVFAVTAVVFLNLWTSPLTAFLFIAIFLTPMVFNAIFHAASSVYFRKYSPGTASAIVLFPGLCWYLVSRFSDAGLLDAISAVAATILGAVIHAFDLASTTFFLERRSRP